MKYFPKLHPTGLLTAMVFLPLAAPGQLVPLFLETFDSGASVETRAPVNLAALGWNLHHSFAGLYLPGRPTGQSEPNEIFRLTTTVTAGGQPAPGDHLIGQPFGYVGIFVNNTPLYGEGTEGARPELPGPHPVTGLYYNNRTLAVFLWKEHMISAAQRPGIREFAFVQGNRDARYHQFFPAVRIGEQWYVYWLPPEELAAVRILGRPSEHGMYGEEGVFYSYQFSEGGAYANHWNAQPYVFPWSESGWTPLTFNGGTGTDSTVGMTLGALQSVDLPAGAITAVGVFSPENIDPDGPSNPGYNFNGHRIDSIQILGEPVEEQLDLFTFTFNNEGTIPNPNPPPDRIDRPIQAAMWNGVYSSAALPAVTGEAIFADLSEGVIPGQGEIPGAYKAGFLFVSGKDGQPAPQGFLLWSENTNVVNEVQEPYVSGVNPQTDWYCETADAPGNLNQILVRDLRELSVYVNPRNKDTVRYHFALKAAGQWYITEQAYQSTGDWTLIRVDAQSANWLTGILGDGFLNLDFAANPPQVVTLGSLPQDTLLTTVGIYIDTDDFVGQTDTWARIDSYMVTAARSSDIVPPTILEQPASLAVVAGQTATFTVVVAETDVAYQWRKDGEDLADATEATLVLENVQPQDAGSYTVRVTGPRGSVVSQAATLTVYPLPVVDPLVIEAAAGGQEDKILVDAVTGLAWAAESHVDWIVITYGETGVGGDFVLISIAANPGYEPRSGTLTVAWATVTVNQAARPLPENFEEVVGAIDKGDGTWASAWFGRYLPLGLDWILHEHLGLLQTGAVVLSSDMPLYSFNLHAWVWTSEAAFPALYAFLGEEQEGWIAYWVIDGVLYRYDYATGEWSW